MTTLSRCESVRLHEQRTVVGNACEYEAPCAIHAVDRYDDRLRCSPCASFSKVEGGEIGRAAVAQFAASLDTPVALASSTRWAAQRCSRLGA